MKISKLPIIVTVLILLLPQLYAQTVNVKVQTIKKENITRFATYVGNIKGLREVSLPSQKDSILNKINGVEGKKYKKNDILLVLDTDRANLALQQAKLALRNALNDLLQQENNLQVAVNLYKFELFSLEISKKELAREKTLYDKGMSSDVLLDSIRKKMEAESIKAAQSKIGLVGIDIDMYKPTYRKQANNQLKQGINLSDIIIEDTVDYIPVKRALIHYETMRAGYKKALLDLSDTYIKAPFNGTLLKNNELEIGQYIRKGEALLSFGDISKVQVEININQTDLSLVKVGTSAKITVDAVPGKEYTGKVASVAQQGDLKNRSFSAKITVNNQKNDLKPGYSARVKLEVPELKNQIIVPSYSIIYGNDETYVFTVTKDLAKKTAIKTGGSIGDNTHVLSGLKTGDQLVIRGQGFLNDNNKVFVVTE